MIKVEPNVGDKSGKIQTKSAAHRTRSKKPMPLAVVKIGNDPVQSVSSYTIESLKDEKMDVDVSGEKELEMS